MTDRPLDGITVVSLEQAVAAPFATRQLADLGARVIKVERNTGDFAREYDTQVHGMASYFVWLNRSKESVVLDLKSAHGLAALRQLIAGADVVVQNLAPGAVDRLGVGAKESLRVNPALVYSSISGYGAGGPYQDKKAYDLLIQCEAGLLSVTGTPDFPSKVGISIADIAAGMYAYSGILSALLKRSRTGVGQHIEVSMLEALGEWMGHPYFYAEYGGQSPARTGASHATIAPYGPFDCSDGVVFIAIQNDREWTRFCAEVVERPELTEDVRYADNARRVQNRSELEATIRPVLRSLLRREVTDRLDSASIANATLRTMEDFSAHPQLEARGRWRQIDSPVGPLRSLVPPVNGDWEPRMDGVPALGDDTIRVLAEFCKDL
ncbi:CaiB/BaiF CoA transferase family protein [Rhodococcus sp. NPDC059968]|uniref:CaiB/BaiF CoA transferase family protein n=1 Tax=Rhodococcus sp. NPDC059968 TaxID=3347017 RepID=UPI00366CF891